MVKDRTYRIALTLSLAEAEALAALARNECRDLRGQAHYLVREGLKQRETAWENASTSTSVEEAASDNQA